MYAPGQVNLQVQTGLLHHLNSRRSLLVQINAGRSRDIVFLGMQPKGLPQVEQIAVVVIVSFFYH